MTANIYKTPISQRYKWLVGIITILASFLSIFIFNRFGMLSGYMLLILPFAIAYILISYNYLVTNIYILLFFSFFGVAFGRYILRDAIPWGIFFDFLLVYGYSIVLLKGVTRKVEWAKILDAPLLVVIIWLFYCLSTVANPERCEFDGWFTAFRLQLYMILSIPLFCLLLDFKVLKIMLVLWAVFSIILSLKGFVQENIWLDPIDRAFLVGNTFHMVMGKLRVFSFLSDAGQFGVQQAHATIFGAIMFLITKNRKLRILFLIMAAVGLYGMFASGTRGAIFVIFGGALVFCFLIRRTKLFIISVILAGSFFCFMSYTNIGNGTYAIFRMRTAFKPEQDDSYLARKLNQAVLKAYLKPRPFGGGLGAMQHGPKESVLASTPYDSGFILIWGDTGIVGLSLYIGMIVIFLIKGSWLVWFRIKNEWLRGVLIALLAGIFGISVANYGNPVMLQYPTNVLYFMSVAIIYSASRMDKSLQKQEEDDEVQPQPTSTKMTLYR